MDSGLGKDIFKIVLGRQLGGREKRCECWQLHYKYERKGRANVASEKQNDDAMEGDGGDETKSSKVVKGLGEDRRVIGAALAAVCNILTDLSPLRPVNPFFPLEFSLDNLRVLIFRYTWKKS